MEWTPLLNTSDSAYIKENVQEIRTYEKEEGDPQGQYTLAASVSDNETGAEVTVISSPYVFTSDMDSMVSGNNLKLFSNITGTFQSEESGGKRHNHSRNRICRIDRGVSAAELSE